MRGVGCEVGILEVLILSNQSVGFVTMWKLVILLMVGLLGVAGCERSSATAGGG